MSEGDWEIVRLVASLAKTMADSLKAEVDFWKDKHMQSQERILMLQSDLTIEFARDGDPDGGMCAHEVVDRAAYHYKMKEVSNGQDNS